MKYPRDFSLPLWMMTWLTGTLNAATPPQSASLPDFNWDYDHSAAHVISVTVEGAVRHPGVYKLKASDTTVTAIEIAGSFAPDALKNQAHINRAPNTSILINLDPKAGASSSPVPLCDGDHVVVPDGGGPILENFIKIRVLSEHSFTVSENGFVRFRPSFAVANNGFQDLLVPELDSGAIALIEFAVVDAKGRECEVVRVSKELPEMRGHGIVAAGGELLFAAPTSYDLKILQPGNYVATAKVGFTRMGSFRKLTWVKSEPFEIQVTAASPSGMPEAPSLPTSPDRVPSR